MLKLWLRPKIYIFFPIGLVSGLPLLLTSSTLGVWLADVVIDRTTIALFALVGMPYAFKFIWAPLIDNLRIVYLSNLLGQRKSWIVLCQIFLIVIIFMMALLDIKQQTIHMAILAFMLAFVSATHDIAVAAWRIEIHNKEELGIGAAMYVTGYRVALLIAGAGTLILADIYSWKMAYLFLAFIVPVGLLSIFLIKFDEPNFKISKKFVTFRQWFLDAALKPFADFKNRHNWILVLLFIALFKWGDALLGVLSLPFMLEIGFSKTQIASVAKIYGFGATLLGLAIGGSIIIKFGIMRSLLFSGILQLISNFLFAFQAVVGNNIKILTVTIGMENLAGGIGTAAFIAYLSSLCNIKHTAFQYALLSSFMAISRTWLSSPSGWLIDNINWDLIINKAGLGSIVFNNSDWFGFFIITAIMALPGLIVLLFLI